MKTNNIEPFIEIVQDMERAISVMHAAGKWLEESGKKPSKWWQPENMNLKFLLQHAEPAEFFVALVNSEPAGAVVLQDNQRNQSWKEVDRGNSINALYVHWLCVSPHYFGKGLAKRLVDFAEKYALAEDRKLLRADTNAQENKLRQVYENLGFQLITVLLENYRQTALYQKVLNGA